MNLRTMKKRLRRGLTAVAEWCRERRHEPVDQQQQTLNAKLRGHYQYYGRPRNSRSLWQFYGAVCKIWRKWLESPNSWKGNDLGKIQCLPASPSFVVPMDHSSLALCGESCLRNPLRGNLYGGVCEGRERRCCQGLTYTGTKLETADTAKERLW